MRNEGEVIVTLLLNGGHSRTLYLRRGDPLLANLLAALAEKGQPGVRPSRLFNIRIDEGRHSLLVASSDLVGLVTDPPLVNEEEARQPVLRAPVQAVGDGGIVKSPYVLIENFLDLGLHAELLNFVAAREKEFTGSSVSTNDVDYRRSHVLQDFPKFSELFRERVRMLVPKLASAFNCGEFPIKDIECQLTTHNDGDYFNLHNDSGSPDTVERTLTYVYYFNKEPKGFSGGEFRLYNSRIADGRYECAEKAVDIEPKNNSMLCFPSYCHHEVLPVRCPTKNFLDGRFTINGLVRRTLAAQRAA